MAFNTWAKLSKAQNDYPKPKFAVPFVDKALKKNPTNPFLLTWKADLGLQQGLIHPDKIYKDLEIICSLPDLTSIDLLSYIYRLSREAFRRRSPNGDRISTVPGDCKPWQAVAKSLKDGTARQQLWSALFEVALHEDSWEDVRFAVVNYIKEGSTSKKNTHYLLILATQLAAEQTTEAVGPQDRMAQLQCDVALKLMKQSYLATPDDPIAVTDIRDLRFMGELFRRQNRLIELNDLWNNFPERLQGLMMRHEDDVLDITRRAIRRNQDWRRLESLSLEIIDDAFEAPSVDGELSPEFQTLCSRRWDVWADLLTATENNGRTTEEAVEFIREKLNLYFGKEFKTEHRSVHLAYMRLRYFSKGSILPDCMEYFRKHSALPSCFNDIRGFVKSLGVDDTLKFLDFTHQYKREDSLGSSIDKHTFDAWRQAQASSRKFYYMLTCGRSKVALEYNFYDTMNLRTLSPRDSDLSFLCIYLLLNMHRRFVCVEEGDNPLNITVNSRILLQATMFARHLVEQDKEKEDRTLSLLAARLHLNLGLGTVAFRLYSHTKCKEMLQDELSLYVLSRISQTHPFDLKGHGGFSADEELARVVETIERMERKTDDIIAHDIPSFLWDQATDVLSTKRKLNSSLTKHICVLERRRIARLKGDLSTDLPALDMKSMYTDLVYRVMDAGVFLDLLLTTTAYKDISDNVDRTIFPVFGVIPESKSVIDLIMPNSIPNEHWLAETNYEREKVSIILYHDPRDLHRNDGWDNKLGDSFAEGVKKGNHTSLEDRMRIYWHKIFSLTCQILYPQKCSPTKDPEVCTELLQHIKTLRKATAQLRMPGNTTLTLENEVTMFHENMLMTCYGGLELCRAVYKLVERLRDKVVNSKNKEMKVLKAKMPNDYDKELLQETQLCYEAFRDVADSYINLIKSRGAAAIKAQVRWGDTGEKLKSFLKNDDLEYYAQEYVTSALESWNGVLKVELK